MNNNRFSTNRNAFIRSRIDKTGKFRTETAGRDHDLDVAATTDDNNSTRVFIDLYGRESYGYADLVLNGRQARTLYRVLSKHFAAQGKSF